MENSEPKLLPAAWVVTFLFILDWEFMEPREAWTMLVEPELNLAWVVELAIIDLLDV